MVVYTRFSWVFCEGRFYRVRAYRHNTVVGSISGSWSGGLESCPPTLCKVLERGGIWEAGSTLINSVKSHEHPLGVCTPRTGHHQESTRYVRPATSQYLAR